VASALGHGDCESVVAALATGAVATINSDVWLLASSLSRWRLILATIVSVVLVIAWLVIDAGLWDHPDEDSPQARERSRLYNGSTVLTLIASVLVCYVGLYAVNLAWAFFVLDPDAMGRGLHRQLDRGDLFVLAWFVASAATIGGGLGSGLETDDAIRAATYSQREQERRERLARDRSR
jgi:4-amino-4-deoxy-L-arabinose transferase-like glycosyltransferase